MTALNLERAPDEVYRDYCAKAVKALHQNTLLLDKFYLFF
jgi:hypothetical protein